MRVTMAPRNAQEKERNMAAIVNAPYHDSKSTTASFLQRSRSQMQIGSGRRSKSPYYEEPVSSREDWWRSTLKDTPVPGAYELRDFVSDMNTNPVKTTYGFKNAGRKRNADPSRKGNFLMPGLYRHTTSISGLDKKKMTYSFKASDRYHTPSALVGYVDKEFVGSQISPNTYDSGYKYVPKMPSKHPAFKSQVQRFPTVYFRPKEGPPPGQYQLSKDSILPKSVNVTSPFKSRTPRFCQPHVLKTPGPGTYDKTFQTPMPDTIKKMGRNYGLFFTCGAYGQY